MMRRVFAWVFLAGYCALITILSSMPQPPMPRLPVAFADKFVHGGAYGALGLLAIVAASTSTRWTPRGVALFAWVFATVFGVSDELHQRTVPGRSFELLDMVADSLGAAIVAGLYLVLHARRRAARAALP